MDDDTFLKTGIVVAIIFQAEYQVPQADEVIVIVGEKQRGHNGLTSNVVVITGGGAFVRS